MLNSGNEVHFCSLDNVFGIHKEVVINESSPQIVAWKHDT